MKKGRRLTTEEDQWRYTILKKITKNYFDILEMHLTIFQIVYRLILIFLPSMYDHHNSQSCRHFHISCRHFLDDIDSTHLEHEEFLGIWLLLKFIQKLLTKSRREIVLFISEILSYDVTFNNDIEWTRVHVSSLVFSTVADYCSPLETISWWGSFFAWCTV